MTIDGTTEILDRDRECTRQHVADHLANYLHWVYKPGHDDDSNADLPALASELADAVMGMADRMMANRHRGDWRVLDRSFITVDMDFKNAADKLHQRFEPLWFGDRHAADAATQQSHDVMNWAWLADREARRTLAAMAPALIWRRDSGDEVLYLADSTAEPGARWSIALADDGRWQVWLHAGDGRQLVPPQDAGDPATRVLLFDGLAEAQRKVRRAENLRLEDSRAAQAAALTSETAGSDPARGGV